MLGTCLFLFVASKVLNVHYFFVEDVYIKYVLAIV